MTDQDIFELLKKQEEAIRKKPVFYVHYEQVSNRILSLRNYLDTTDPYPYIELSEDTFNFSSPEFNISNYIVDPIDKIIKKFENELVQVTTIDSYIYEIPKVVSKTQVNKPFDLLIEQDNSLKEFRLSLSKDLREKFGSQKLILQEITVYVTAVNDPNVLYKTLKCSFTDVIQNEYHVIPFGDFEDSEANIYSMRYFENYLHVDLRDGK